MPLPPRFANPRTHFSRDDILAEQRAQTPPQNVGVFIFPMMKMQRRGERPRSERMMDDREAPIAGGTVEFPVDAQAAKVDAFSRISRDDRERWW